LDDAIRMSLSTSPFKPWLVALTALLAIEVAYWAYARPPRVMWNSFLDLKFAQTDTFQRLAAYRKIVAFEDVDPDIIQVGDSSGFHGVQPPIVMSYIPGWRYLNMSLATNLGYSGYYNIAKLQLERSPHARYLILYTSLIGGVPRKFLWDENEPLMAPIIYDEFLSPLHRLAELPTLAARRGVTDYVYYLGYRYKRRGAALSTNRGYLAFDAIFRQSNGWTRETDVEGDIAANIYRSILPNIDVNEKAASNAVRAALRRLPRVTDERFFDWWTLKQVSYFDLVYGKFAQLAEDYGVQLVLIFNPFPRSTQRPEFGELMDWKAIEAGLRRVRKRHPEVIVTGFDFWPDERFSVFSHVAAPYSDDSSRRVGGMMKDIIGNRKPVERLKSVRPKHRLNLAEIDFSKPYAGYGWTDATGATVHFPLQYVGLRDKTWVWLAVSPGASYLLRARFTSGESDLPRLLNLKANGSLLRMIASRRDGAKIFSEWKIPETISDMYGGWLILEFDFMGAKAIGTRGRRSIEFERIAATPIQQNPHAD
jgi:hypothetical protein